MNFWKDGQIKPADRQYNNSLIFNRYWTEINTNHYSIIKEVKNLSPINKWWF